MKLKKTETEYLRLKIEPNRTEIEKSKPTQSYLLFLFGLVDIQVSFCQQSLHVYYSTIFPNILIISRFYLHQQLSLFVLDSVHVQRCKQHNHTESRDTSTEYADKTSK